MKSSSARKYSLTVIFMSTIMAATGTISADYHWTFDNKEGTTTYTSTTVTENSAKLLSGSHIVQSFERYGRVLYLDGINSGIYIHNLTSNCFLNPQTCLGGFSISFWAKGIKHGSAPIICSTGFLVKQLAPEMTVIEVLNGASTWQIFHTTAASFYSAWTHYAITWNSASLDVYVNGQRTDSKDTTIQNGFLKQISQLVPGRLAVGIQSSLVVDSSLMKMYLDDLKIWDICLGRDDVAAVYNSGLFNSDLFMVKDSSTSNFQLLYVDPKYHLTSSSQGPNEIVYRGVTFDGCFIKCKDLNSCESIAYKPGINGKSFCLLFEGSSFSFVQIDYAGYHFYLMSKMK